MVDAGPIAEMSMEDVKRVFDTNTFSILRVARSVIPSMARHRAGLIVTIGSVVGERYAHSKCLFAAQLTIASPQHDTLEWAVLCHQSGRTLDYGNAVHGMQAAQHRRDARCTGRGQV
jgi:NAD(P)-dependent dehydrogenase (short-subunit alcohol dehydrogenase family)